MILWGNIENYPCFFLFDSDPRFPPFLLYVRWKSGVTFVRRCFRDADKFSTPFLGFRYAGVIFSVSNTLAQIPGFVAPAIVGVMTSNVSITLARLCTDGETNLIIEFCVLSSMPQ